jgi:hypothetical protein
MDQQVRRIHLFLADIAEDWPSLSETMRLNTTEITGTRANAFERCSTPDGFCNACDMIASKVCKMATFSFDFRYNECFEAIAKQKSNYGEGIANRDENSVRQMEQYLEQHAKDFQKKIFNIFD